MSRLNVPPNFDETYGVKRAPLDAQRHYDAWAPDYDHDLVDEYGYLAPAIAASEAAQGLSDKHCVLLDVGCGTGLAGAALRGHGFNNVEGFDISPGMLELARQKKVYTALHQGDLNQRTALAGANYAAIVCVSSIAPGHLGQSALSEMIRLLAPRGLLILYVGERYYQSLGLERQIGLLQVEGLVQLESNETSNYMTVLRRTGRLIVMTRSLHELSSIHGHPGRL